MSDSQKKKRRKKRQTPPSSNSKPVSKKKRVLTNIFIALLLIVGLALVFNNQIKDWLVRQSVKQNQIANVSKQAIKENEKKKVSFDFDKVNSLDFETVVKSRLYQDQLYVVGGIAIPDVQINLPIYKGLSNYALVVGAGTMKPDQQMGKKNYALASHHMLDESILFGPLINSQLGQKMFLTDLEHIYEYKITYKEYVEPTRTELIDDVPKKELLTLVTCDITGAQRLIVQGKLTKIKTTKHASKEMIQAFDLEKNT